MNVMQVLNVPEREIEIMERIRAQILLREPGAQVDMVEFRDPAFLEKVLTARPDIILTYPFSAFPVARSFYPLKYLLGCHIVCLRVEGILYFDLDNIRTHIGPDRYGNQLVDYEIIWGEEAARHMADELLRQNKISSRERVKTFGYVLYEDYFRPRAASTLPEAYLKKIGRHQAEKILFFVTGFTQADYSQEDIIRSGDQVDVNNPATFAQELNYRLFRANRSAFYRSVWTKKIVEVARKHPDVLIVVKSHPTENFVNRRLSQNPYQDFQDCGNIIHVTHCVPIIELMQRCGLFLHYGSTTAAESYLARKPSILIESEDYVLLPNGWRSTRKINIYQLPDLIAEHLRNPITYEEFPETASILRHAFNIRAEHMSGRTIYQPSGDMAEFLIGLQNERPQLIGRQDPYLADAMAANGNRVLAILKKNKAAAGAKQSLAAHCSG